MVVVDGGTEYNLHICIKGSARYRLDLQMIPQLLKEGKVDLVIGNELPLLEAPIGNWR